MEGDLESSATLIGKIVILLVFGSIIASILANAARTGIISWKQAGYVDRDGQRPGYVIDRDGLPLSYWFTFAVLAGMILFAFSCAAYFAWILFLGWSNS